MEIVYRRRSNYQKEPWFDKSSWFACFMRYFPGSCSGVIKSNVPRGICLVRVAQTAFVWQISDLDFKRSVLKNFAKFIGKHLCRSLFLNKVVGLSSIFKNTFFTEYLRATASVDSPKLVSLYCNGLFFYGHMFSSAVSVIFP